MLSEHPMTAEERLITIYLLICDAFPFLAETVERMSWAEPPDFTGEEILTIYLFGILERRCNKTEIHQYIKNHWSRLKAYEFSQSL